MMKSLVRWIGPECPWGPTAGGIFAVTCLILGVAVLAPPMVALSRAIFGWWWSVWL